MDYSKLVYHGYGADRILLNPLDEGATFYVYAGFYDDLGNWESSGEFYKIPVQQVTSGYGHVPGFEDMFDGESSETYVSLENISVNSENPQINSMVDFGSPYQWPTPNWLGGANVVDYTFALTDEAQYHILSPEVGFFK